MAAWLRSPGPYVAWTLGVLVALPVAWYVDPYVFAFTMLGLAWATGAVALAGLALVVFGRSVTGRARAVVAVALVVAAAALAFAWHALDGIHWA